MQPDDITKLETGRAGAGSERPGPSGGATPAFPGQHRPRNGINARSQTQQPGSTGDEDLPAAPVHLVERPDLRHPILDLAVRRVRRHRRVRQSLLSHQGRPDRSDAGFRAALGDLQRHRGSLDDPADLARLDAPHRRSTADAGDGEGAPLGKAAPAQSHGDPRRLSPERLDFGKRPPAPRRRATTRPGRRGTKADG